MGLDRVAVVLQKVDSVYETDTMKPIFDKVQSVSDELSGKNAVRDIRIVVDHLKAATFMLAAGVLPSNVDRGYVLRRIIRRAIRAARKLGAIQAAGFCSGIANTVIDQYGDFYAHLRAEQQMIVETLNREEETFLKTLQDGMKHFQKLIVQLSGKEISGLDAFHLYDTYGFPIELTREMAAEQNIKVDEEGFLKAFELHQQKSRAGAEKKFSGGLADHSDETTKLHTATHLLNAALRKVLGDHVFQKGSNITAERLRFDFVHPTKMTPEQIKQVEDLVNDSIKADAQVSYRLMTVDEAKTDGAIGVFESKYGEQVKVYSMGNFSKEICGGPHVAKTGMLGSFKIQKEESSSAGVRRIKAIVTGGPKEIEVAGEMQ
jgi:alanyl-tRNA synthetase